MLKGVEVFYMIHGTGIHGEPVVETVVCRRYNWIQRCILWAIGIFKKRTFATISAFGIKEN